MHIRNVRGPLSSRPRINIQDPNALDPTAVSKTPEPARSSGESRRFVIVGAVAVVHEGGARRAADNCRV